MSGSDDNPNVTILMADDDPDDCRLTADAFQAAHLSNPLHFVADGEELLRYLRRVGRYADHVAYPMPGLILLDLNMPRMDGREVLAELKNDPELRHIPVVVLTTSSDDGDIRRSYALGGNSFITKPVTFGALVEVVQGLGHYWLNLVDLPPEAAP